MNNFNKNLKRNVHSILAALWLGSQNYNSQLSSKILPRRNPLNYHNFHILKPSVWPFAAALSLLLLAFGLVNWFYSGKTAILVIGLVQVIFVVFFWWSDVSQESGETTEEIVKNLKLGMALFIVSEVMFFFSFFWAFFQVSLVPGHEIGGVWPPVGLETIVIDPWSVPLLNTILLLSSGVTVTCAHHALLYYFETEKLLSAVSFSNIIIRLKKQNYFTFENVLLILILLKKQAIKLFFLGVEMLVITITLALLFTALQLYEYIESLIRISDSAYGSTFFVMTGFHGLHVIVGTIFLTVCLFRLAFNHFYYKASVGLEASIWYWHFVDVIWILLYITVYMWGNKQTKTKIKKEDFWGNAEDLQKRKEYEIKLNAKKQADKNAFDAYVISVQEQQINQDLKGFWKNFSGKNPQFIEGWVKELVKKQGIILSEEEERELTGRLLEELYKSQSQVRLKVGAFGQAKDTSEEFVEKQNLAFDPKNILDKIGTQLNILVAKHRNPTKEEHRENFAELSAIIKEKKAEHDKIGYQFKYKSEEVVEKPKLAVDPRNGNILHRIWETLNLAAAIRRKQQRDDFAALSAIVKEKKVEHDEATAALLNKDSRINVFLEFAEQVMRRHLAFHRSQDAFELKQLRSADDMYNGALNAYVEECRVVRKTYKKIQEVRAEEYAEMTDAEKEIRRELNLKLQHLQYEGLKRLDHGSDQIFPSLFPKLVKGSDVVDVETRVKWQELAAAGKQMEAIAQIRHKAHQLRISYGLYRINDFLLFAPEEKLDLPKCGCTDSFRVATEWLAAVTDEEKKNRSVNFRERYANYSTRVVDKGDDSFIGLMWEPAPCLIGYNLDPREAEEGKAVSYETYSYFLEYAPTPQQQAWLTKYREKFFSGRCDFAAPGQYGFQDSATPIMDGISDLHHRIMAYLILIFIVVIWIMFSYLSKIMFIIKNKTLQSYYLILPYILPDFFRSLFQTKNKSSQLLLKKKICFFSMVANLTTNFFGYFINYYNIFFFIILSTLVALLLYLVSIACSGWLVTKEIEKISTYECGFIPFSDSRIKFDISFYVISILFIIFDLEIVFLFPWAVCFCEIGLIGFFSMVLFFVILTIGFIFEWVKGGLEL